MNSDGCCISTNDSPVFVCQRCGGMLRALFYEAGDEIACDFCEAATVKTSYTLSDDDGYLMYGNDKESRQFQAKVFSEYVKDSGKLNKKMLSARKKSLKNAKKCLNKH